MPQRGILVTRDSLLVTRVSPFAEASGDKSSFAEASGDKPHPPSCKARPPPPPQITTHANFVCAGPGVGHPSAKFPSIEGVAACRRGGKRVRN